MNGSKKIAVAVILLFLWFGTNLFGAKLFAATGGNPSSVGPFPEAGTVKLFFKILPKTALNTVTLSNNVQTVSLNLPEGGNNGVVDSRTTTFTVNQNDYITVFLHNTSLNVDALGFTDPTSNFACGTSGVGDGVHSFTDLEVLAESNNTQIVARHCWEDWTGGDNDFNDVTIIYTYDHIVVLDTPTPQVGFIDFLGVKLGRQHNSSVDRLLLQVCPLDVFTKNFWIGLACLFK